MKAWLLLMRGCGPSKGRSWFWQRKKCGFDRSDDMVLAVRGVVLAKKRVWSWLMRGCIQAKESVWSQQRRKLVLAKERVWFCQMRGVVFIDVRSGSGRLKEQSWKMRGVVMANERSGLGR